MRVVSASMIRTFIHSINQFSTLCRFRSLETSPSVKISDPVWPGAPLARCDHIIYPFGFRNPVTGKWARARHVAELDVIAASYKEWEVTGPPEIRLKRAHGYFTPHSIELVAPRPRPIGQRYLELGPHRGNPPRIDASERRLVGVFLRRWIVYAARKGQNERVRNATDLLIEVVGPSRRGTRSVQVGFY